MSNTVTTVWQPTGACATVTVHGTISYMPASGQLAELSRLRALARSGDARRLRERAAIGLCEMAKVVGVDPATLSRWERGVGRPRGRAASRWARELAQLGGAARSIGVGVTLSTGRRVLVTDLDTLREQA
jgi:DNA-binding XRE family transcriptional regulator